MNPKIDERLEKGDTGIGITESLPCCVTAGDLCIVAGPEFEASTLRLLPFSFWIVTICDNSISWFSRFRLEQCSIEVYYLIQMFNGHGTYVEILLYSRKKGGIVLHSFQ